MGAWIVLIVILTLFAMFFFANWSVRGGAAKTRATRCLIRYFDTRKVQGHDQAIVSMVRMLFPASSDAARAIYVGASHEDATSDKSELVFVIGAVNVLSNLIPPNDPGGHQFIEWLAGAIDHYSTSYGIEVSESYRPPCPDRFIKPSTLPTSSNASSL